MTTPDPSGNRSVSSQVSAQTRSSPPAYAVGWAGWLLAVLALVSGLAAGAWATHYWLGRQIQARYLQQQQVLQASFDRVRADLSAQQARADTLAGQLVIERSTLQGLETALKAAQEELRIERDKVAFYEQLIPPGPLGAVAVRALDIEQQGPILNYRAVLMRNARSQQPFNGRLQFIAKGQRQGKSVELELFPAKASSASDAGGQQNADAQPGNPPGTPQPPGQANQDTGESQQVAAAAEQALLQVSFEQFQRLGGLLQLPPDFLPQQITLNVLEGDTVRASRTVSLGADTPD